MEYTLYDPETGFILHSGTSPQPDVYLKQHPGASIDLGVAHDCEEFRKNMSTGCYVPYERPKTHEEIIAAVLRERDRRFELGLPYKFPDSRGLHLFATTAEDMKGWADVDRIALRNVAIGKGGAPIDIVTEVGPVTVTSSEWLDVMEAFENLRQPVWAASFELLKMDPIPQDPTDPQYWP